VIFTKDGPVAPQQAGSAPSRLRGVLRRLRREESGFTLIELLVATVLALVVVGGPMTFIIVSLDQSNAAVSRSSAARQLNVGLDRLTRDLREAQLVTNSAGVNQTPVTISNTAGVATASFNLPTPGSVAAGQTVVWTCTPGANCTRKVGAGSAIPVIRGVTAATFTGNAIDGSAATSNPAFVSVVISVQVTSLSDTGQTHTVRGTSNPIVVQDGVALRNYS
jgi:prepilin-type N-terminal cleavage/methylation domain-containing protein